MSKKSVAILGVSGYVGNRFVQMLKDHPWFDLEMITGYETAGMKLSNPYVWKLDSHLLPEEFANERVQPSPDPKVMAERVDIAFSALPSSASPLEYEQALANYGVKVFSNSSPGRMEYPLVTAEVNPQDLKLVEEQETYKQNGGFIVKNANCAAIGLVVAVKPIHDRFGIDVIDVVTAQAISGAGKSAYPGGAMHDNLIPYIGGNEEEKIETESQRMLGGPNLAVYAMCSRTSVMDGHTEFVKMNLEKRVSSTVEAIKDAMHEFNPLREYELPSSPKEVIHVFEEEDRPQPKLDALLGDGMTVSVGRLEWGKTFDLRCVVLSHNTIRGAAGASLLNAELAREYGVI